MNDIGYFDRDGIWISENQIGFTLWLEKHANKRAVLKLKRWFPQRSKAENSYMHYMFSFIGEHIGYSMEDAKGFYKIHFKVKHTSELTTAECEEFLENVRRHCLEFHGLRVPLPNEIIYEE